MSNQQYQANSQGGTFALVPGAKPTPGPKEVCIRPKTVSVNPIDWKNLQFGAMVKSWPAVLGIEGAGIVESVGADVTTFKVGDEVMSYADGNRGTGSFQEVYAVPEVYVAKKPQGLSFEEATSLPIAYLTAGATIQVGLSIPIPGLSNLAEQNAPKSVLILGGSSAVGSSAIQLLRLALPSAHLVTTSSAQHHAHLKSLGASQCLERAAQEDAAALQAASPDGTGVDAVIDAVGAALSAPAVFGALRADGPRRYAMVVTGPPPTFPEGVYGRLVGGEDLLGAEPAAMPYLAGLVEEGKFRLPVKVNVVGKGWDAVAAGLARYPVAVSGAKMVVDL